MAQAATTHAPRPTTIGEFLALPRSCDFDGEYFWVSDEIFVRTLDPSAPTKAKEAGCGDKKLLIEHSVGKYLRFRGEAVEHLLALDSAQDLHPDSSDHLDPPFLDTIAEFCDKTGFRAAFAESLRPDIGIDDHLHRTFLCPL